MDSTELDGLVEAASDNTDPLVGKLRAALEAQGKDLKATKAAAEKAAQDLKARERNDLFDLVGVPAEGTGALLRSHLANEEELTAEMIREQATTFGIIEPPAPVVGQGEQQAHQMIADAGSAPPAAVPDVATRLAEAAARNATPEEILAIAQEGGVSAMTY